MLFLKLVFSLIGGILIGSIVCGPECFDWVLTGGIAGFLLLSAVYPRLGLSPILLSFLLAGIILGRQDPVPEVPGGLIHARICDELLASGNGVRTTIDRIRYLDGDQWVSVKGRASVYFAVKKGSSGISEEPAPALRDLKPGTFILADAQLSTYSPPMNPQQFDYAGYQRGRGILYQLYLDPDSWSSDGRKGRTGLKIRSLLFRRELMGKIDSEISGSSRAILHALLLGYRKEMDPELKQNFARSGTLHILAVSGLHVGIIYLLPALLLRRLKHRPLAGIPAGILVFAGLWAYAFLTGMSSSVVRAVTMCCIHGIAMMSRRKAGSLHVVSLTAFIMIILRPPVIFEAGFQLSFLAVAGIVILYPGFMNFFKKEQRQISDTIPAGFGRVYQTARRWISRMVAVSLAAQLSTLPLSILYFNQFAPASILANLLVIPLATLILYTGFGYLIFAGTGSLAAGLSSVLRILSSLLEWFTRNLADLPGAYVGDLSMVSSQVILLYTGGVLLLVYLRRRTPGGMFLLLGSVILLLAVSGFREYRIRKHRKIYVFSLQHETAIVFVNGRQSFLYGNIREAEDLGGLPWELEPFFRHYKLETPHELVPDERVLQEIYSPGMKGDYFNFKGRRMLVLREWDRRYAPKLPNLELDVLVLCGNPRVSADQLLSHFSVSQIVTDGSCSPWYTKKMEEECRKTAVSFHSTREKGCFSY